MSLERMDKVFGEVDAVAAGEDEGAAEKVEALTYGEHGTSADGPTDLDEKRPVPDSHVENTVE